MMDAFYGTGFDMETVKSIVEDKEVKESRGQYVIAWWKGGDENGYWFPTSYRFDEYADAQEKIRELSKDGHTYKAFDDTHGLPDTKEVKESNEDTGKGDETHGQDGFMIRVTDAKGHEMFVTGDKGLGKVTGSEKGKGAKNFSTKEEAQSFIDKHKPEIPGKVSFRIVPDKRKLNPMMQEDNSHGMGEYRPRFSPNQYVTADYKRFDYFPNQGVSMYTYDANEKFTIMQRDLESLMDSDLMRISVNNPGEISLYFKKEAEKVS